METRPCGIGILWGRGTRLPKSYLRPPAQTVAPSPGSNSGLSQAPRVYAAFHSGGGARGVSPPPGLQPGSRGGPSPTRGPGGRGLLRRRSELSCSPSLSGDRSGLAGAEGFGDRGGWRSSIPPPPLLPRGGGGGRGGGPVGRGSGQEKT